MSATPVHFTPRELEIWKMIAEDNGEKVIADKLGITKSTVSKHREHLYRKLGVHTIVGATRAAVAHGIVVIERVK